MRNEILRHKKIARNKKRRMKRQKSYSANEKCKFGAMRTNDEVKEQNRIFDNLKNGLGL